MERSATPATIIRTLAETAARAQAVAKRHPASQLMASPGPGGWSANEVLWHIRAVADVHTEHLDRILNEDTPRWRHGSPRARMKKSRYDELPFAESLAAFKRQRAELVARLKCIAPEAWQRAALVWVPHYASDWRLTLHMLAWGMADHEEGHCAQLEQVAAGEFQPGKRKTPVRRKPR
jgi:hypothetical protein